MTGKQRKVPHTTLKEAINKRCLNPKLGFRDSAGSRSAELLRLDETHLAKGGYSLLLANVLYLVSTEKFSGPRPPGPFHSPNGNTVTLGLWLTSLHFFFTLNPKPEGCKQGMLPKP